MERKTVVGWQMLLMLGFFAMMVLGEYPLTAAALGGTIYLLCFLFGMYRALLRGEVERLSELAGCLIIYGFVFFWYSPRLPISASNVFDGFVVGLLILGVSYLAIGERSQSASF